MYEEPPVAFKIRVPAGKLTAEALQKVVDMNPAPEDAIQLNLSAG